MQLNQDGALIKARSLSSLPAIEVDPFSTSFLPYQPESLVYLRLKLSVS
jgi:hypothetical protein